MLAETGTTSVHPEDEGGHCFSKNFDMNIMKKIAMLRFKGLVPSGVL